MRLDNAAKLILEWLAILTVLTLRIWFPLVHKSQNRFGLPDCTSSRHYKYSDLGSWSTGQPKLFAVWSLGDHIEDRTPPYFCFYWIISHFLSEGVRPLKAWSHYVQYCTQSVWAWLQYCTVFVGRRIAIFISVSSFFVIGSKQTGGTVG